MIAPPENPRPAYDEMATPPAEVALSPVLWQVLFDPASWRESLDAYAHTTHLAVALVDVAGSRRIC